MALTRGVALCLLIWLSSSLHAQDSPVVDTVAGLPLVQVVDSVLEKEAVPEEEYSITDEEDTEEEKVLFLPKWMTGTRRDSVWLRRLPDSVSQAMKSDKSFWYANAIFEKKKKEKKHGAARRGEGGAGWLNSVLWVLIIGGFAAFLVLFLANSNVRIFRKSSRIKAEEGEEPGTENIFAINYQKEIDKAAGEGNYRLATRLLFLRLLRNMADRNIIQYKQDRTNFDYLAQLHNTAWYDGFFRIMRNYEFAWYGLFDVDHEQYAIIRKDFENFEKML